MISLDMKNAKKKYSGFSLDIEEFRLERNSIKALVGKNGAGKTTLLKAILDQVKLDQGKISIDGFSNNSVAVKNSMGFSFGDTPIINPDFNALEIDKIMKNIYQSWDGQLYFSMLNELNIPLKKNFQNLSTGMKIKLNLIIAISHHPKLMIIDEITSNLDPVSRKEILMLLKKVKDIEGTSILFSTHIIEDLRDIADSVAIIRDGKIILEESIENLERYYVLKNKKEESDQEIFHNGSAQILCKVRSNNHVYFLIKEIIEYCLE